MKKAIYTLGLALAVGLLANACGSGSETDEAAVEQEVKKQDSLQNELQKSTDNVKAKEAELKKAMEELETLRESQKK